MYCLAVFVAHIMVARWTLNWPSRLMNRDGWNIEVRGLTLDSLSRGLARETDMYDIDPVETRKGAK